MAFPFARGFAQRFAAEQAALARRVRGLPSTRARKDYASLLLHRLMFVRFLQAKGLLPRRVRVPVMFRQEPWAAAFVVGEPQSVDVPAEAVARLSAFLDAYDWSLDTAAAPADNRLTPTVLGPLFERHVNRKEQGAYYTKDDVTAYLASRTIVPLVLDAAGLPPWGLLRADPDRYIPSAVRSAGRLPTETDGEARARRRHCRDLRARLLAGDVPTVNDLVTWNLDLGLLAGDVIASADEATRAARILPVLRSITVLDPTCGSGAFLVAALRVLERLWAACGCRGIDARRHILSRSLFGVDLMTEAVELCRMRLLLELAAAASSEAELGDVAAVVANVRAGNIFESQPAEFPEVVNAGGFDVVLGNPPYLPSRRASVPPAVSAYRTASCPDVYAWVLERAAALLRPGGRCGMIVPLSLGFSAAFAPCRQLLVETCGENWFASFGRIPAALFAGDVRVRNTLHIGHKTDVRGRQHTTRLHRWFEAARPHLLPTLEYVSFNPECWRGRVPKLNTPGLARAFEACLRRKPARLRDSLSRHPTPHALYCKKTAYNWLTFCPALPECFDAAGRPAEQTQYDALYFATRELRDLAFLLLNGKWVYAYWCAVGDDFHVARWMFADFPIDLERLPAGAVVRLLPLARELDKAMRAAASFKRNAGKRVGSYNLARCRHVTDRSDRVFADVLALADVWDDLELLVQQVVRTEFEPTKGAPQVLAAAVDGGTMRKGRGCIRERQLHDAADILGPARAGSPNATGPAAPAAGPGRAAGPARGGHRPAQGARAPR